MSKTANEGKCFDRRVVERYVQKGIVAQDEYKTFMKDLPDDTNNATYVQLDLHDTELGDSSSEDQNSSEES